jgi:hypothetical protein
LQPPFAGQFHQLSAINHQPFFKEQPPVYHIIGETIVRHYRCFEVTGDE